MREQNRTILTYIAQKESQRISYFILERFSLLLLCKTQRSNLRKLACAKNHRNWNPSIHHIFNRIRGDASAKVSCKLCLLSPRSRVEHSQRRSNCKEEQWAFFCKQEGSGRRVGLWVGSPKSKQIPSFCRKSSGQGRESWLLPSPQSLPWWLGLWPRQSTFLRAGE